MRPLQDQCEETPYEDVERLFVSDMGGALSEYFEDFDPQPIGIASLAQVHVGRWKGTGEMVAVKVGCNLPAPLVAYLIRSSFNILISQNSVTLTWRWSKYLLAGHPILSCSSLLMIICRMDQTLVSRIRVHMAGTGNEGKPTKRNGFHI